MYVNPENLRKYYCYSEKEDFIKRREKLQGDDKESPYGTGGKKRRTNFKHLEVLGVALQSLPKSTKKNKNKIKKIENHNIDSSLKQKLKTQIIWQCGKKITY